MDTHSILGMIHAEEALLVSIVLVVTARRATRGR